MESNITKKVIFSYFAGTCTALQKNLIEKWTKEEANRELFFEWLYEWEKTNVQYKVELEKGLDRFRSWVECQAETEGVQLNKMNDQPTFSQIPATTTWSLRWLLVAASFLLFSILTGWLVKDRIIYKTYETAFGEIQKIVLPDGSKVVLNANSVFRVPRFGFGKNTREVFLKGEASFDIVHTLDNKNFLVLTEKGMRVEVLGTEFNVYSRLSGSSVVLNSGKIELHYPQGIKQEKVIMNPGDLATLDAKGKLQIAHTAQPQNFSAWKYHRFVFEDTPFREICNRLEETYGNKIVIENAELAKQFISGSFTALDAEELLELLGEAGNFHFSYKENQINVTKNNLSEVDSL